MDLPHGCACPPFTPMPTRLAALTKTGRSVRSQSFLDFHPAETDTRRPVVLNIRAGVPEQRSRQRLRPWDRHGNLAENQAAQRTSY